MRPATATDTKKAPKDPFEKVGEPISVWSSSRCTSVVWNSEKSSEVEVKYHLPQMQEDLCLIASV